MAEAKEHKSKKILSGIGLYYLVLVVVTGGALLWGLVKTQWIDGDMWRQKAQIREKNYQYQPAHRGNIYSTDGKILATTVPVCNLYLDLGRWMERDKAGNLVHDSLGHVAIGMLLNDTSYRNHIDDVCRLLHEAIPSRPAAEFKARIEAERNKENPKRCFLVQRNVPYSYWMQINRTPGWRRAVVKYVDGQSVIHEVRAHTYGNLAENTIGFRNSRESETYTGLEGFYNEQLRGQDGLFLCRRLTKGVWLPINEGGHIDDDNDSIQLDSTVVRPVIHGSHIVSTIDTRFQDIAENALRKALNQYGGESGCAILMEMSTGYVLACSNLSLDTAAHAYRELPNRNIACSDQYEPGSTFKTVILTAMMSDPTLQIDTAMRLRVGYKRFPGKDGDIQDDHTVNGRDTLSLTDVIAQSSNVGMCELGWMYFRNRRDTLRTLVENIFPYQTLHLDVRAGEYASRINNINASNRDFLNFCYGYSTSVSAMQLLTFYNALGSGGRMVKPLFCRAIVENGRETPIEPVVLDEQICSPQVASVMRDLLIGVVEKGTGNNIRNNTYGIAGKTGTAVNNYRNMRRYNASFAGFFPSENPKYSCLVVVKDIPAYGRQAAVVFKSISDCVMAVDKELGNIKMGEGSWRYADGRWVLQDSGVRSTPYVAKSRQDDLRSAYEQLRLPYLSQDSSSRWVVYDNRPDSNRAAGRYERYIQPESNAVPDCTGMTIKDALQLLYGMGYHVRFSGYGRVRSQSPRPRTATKPGATVVLELRN